ncbi:hypothetical protein ANN_27216 [Periplaneta americana]|uniref:Uncharacterized protein n=1 Tax=Periplaneta americana TaxID=6978 RepID=A0ABQ8RXE7_PERAM|nr:hypothetical protein ANN_27216 [Periplaneta americana]
MSLENSIFLHFRKGVLPICQRSCLASTAFILKSTYQYVRGREHSLKWITNKECIGICIVVQIGEASLIRGDDCAKVIWSDETRISIFGSDGIKYVRRRNGEALNPECLIATMKDPVAVIWRCMSMNGVGRFQIFQGNMNAEKYKKGDSEYQSKTKKAILATSVRLVLKLIRLNIVKCNLHRMVSTEEIYTEKKIIKWLEEEEEIGENGNSYSESEDNIEHDDIVLTDENSDIDPTFDPLSEKTIHHSIDSSSDEVESSAEEIDHTVQTSDTDNSQPQAGIHSQAAHPNIIVCGKTGLVGEKWASLVCNFFEAIKYSFSS